MAMILALICKIKINHQLVFQYIMKRQSTQNGRVYLLVGIALNQGSFIKLLSPMDRLLKLVENRPSSLDYERQNQGIFDIQTYQKAIDRISCSSSLEHTSNKRRLSLVQTVRKYTNSALPTQAYLKQEIRPHQAKQIVSRITEIIKTKKEAARFLSPDRKSTQRIHQNPTNDKKASYSAYINARKKIYERQNPNSYSLLAHSQAKDNNCKEPAVDEHNTTQDMFASDYFNNHQLPSQLDLQNYNLNYMNSTMNKYQRIRLEGIVTKKQIEAKKAKETDKCSETHNFEGRPRLPRSFITVIKKRSNDSHLMINSTKQMASQKKIEENGPSTDSFIKNFSSQAHLQEEEIELFPKVSKIIKFRRLSQNALTIPQINSKSATILHCINDEVRSIFNLNQRQKLEIASITKTMTCFLALIIADKFCIDIKKEKIIVSERASKMPGTSAKLAYSDVLTVYETLHALMLPSGNDAAIALGEWGGKQIRKYSSLLRRMKVSKQEESDRPSSLLAVLALKRKSHLKLFIHHMNRLSKHLQLSSTHFVNTHGLMNERAFSCSHNVSLLTYYAMAHPTFREIVAKQAYRCRVFNRTFSHSKDVLWENTNKLLTIDGFLGVKTGITPSAGPCLTSYFQASPSEYFIVTILKTKSCEMRFKQTINILKATLLHLGQSGCSAYAGAVASLEAYNRSDFREDEKEFLNNCRESTMSNQSNDEPDDDQFNELAA